MPDGVSVQLSRKERAFLQHRGEIISAAESVFAEKGYVSTTMEEIARRAEFAVGTLYKFFENKANLHTEILHTKLDQLEKEASAVLYFHELSFSIPCIEVTPRISMSRLFTLNCDFLKWR